MRFIVSPTCAAENNECHNNEDFPDMSSEGNLFNLIDQPCNVTVGERETIEDFCEAIGDELKIDGSFSATIGSISLVTDAEDKFERFEIRIDKELPQTYSGASFVVVRNNVNKPQLGSGNSLEGAAGTKVLSVLDAEDILSAALIRQGDENKNGSFGDGNGAVVRAGDSHGSYIVRRLLNVQTSRARMPLNGNSDNPTEVNAFLSTDEMYAVMSWINCLEPSEGPYAEIHYDCAANATNFGSW